MPMLLVSPPLGARDDRGDRTLSRTVPCGSTAHTDVSRDAACGHLWRAGTVLAEPLRRIDTPIARRQLTTTFAFMRGAVMSVAAAPGLRSAPV